jgi:hypothetical protein
MLFWSFLDKFQQSAHQFASVEAVSVQMSASVMQAGAEVCARRVSGCVSFGWLKLSDLPRRMLARVLLECSWHLHL